MLYAEALALWEQGKADLPVQCQHRGHKGRCQKTDGHSGIHVPSDHMQAEIQENARL